MDARREAEELVGLWQELQEAQVAGDAGRLEWLRARAESEARHEDVSPEWQLLADDAGRHLERLRDELAQQPSAGVGAAEAVVVEPDAGPEPVEDGEGGGRGKGSLIWLAILAGWILLQVLQAVGGGEG